MLRLGVPAEVDFPLEGPSTGVTGERFKARVLTAMSDQVGALAERLVAVRALVRLLPWNTQTKTRG